MHVSMPLIITKKICTSIVASARQNENTIDMHLLSDNELAKLPNKIKQNITNWHAIFISVPAKNIHRFDRI